MTPSKASPREAAGPGTARPPRADAQRNRARILDAAEAVFAEQGGGASTEEVARRAGVGIGTVFRHFPTKGALLGAVLVARLRRFVAEADALAAADDPGEALFAFLARVVGQSATKQLFADALAGASGDIHSVTAEVRQELRRAVGALLARAQRAGAVRADIRLPELLALLVGASKAAEYVDGDRDAQTRLLGILFAGLRPPDRHPLVVGPRHV